MFFPLLTAVAQTATPSVLPIWAQWISALAPVATAVAAVVAFFAYLQKKRSDDRADWWARAVKAIDLMTTKDDMISVNAGMSLASRLADSKNVTQEDRALFAAVIRSIVEAFVDETVDENKRAAREQKARPRGRMRTQWTLPTRRDTDG